MNSLAERFKEWRAKPRQPKPIQVEPAPAKPVRVCLQWPEANADTRRAGKRMNLPDPKPAVVPRTKRNQGRSALTRIAEQLPAKLPRVLFDL